VENILMRVAEGWMTKRATKRLAPGGDATPGPATVREARAAAKARIEKGGVVYAGLKALTWLMHVDVLLFGRVRSGPFFALLVKDGPPRTA
jgi:hypothetical protein